MSMQVSTGGCGRVVKTKLKDGSYSFGFSISRNLRINGRATHITLAPILTVKESEFGSQANAFWKIVDEKISELTKAGELWVNDKSKIENKFSEYIPKPIPAITKAATTPASNNELLRNLIKEVAEKAEKRLNAERV